VGVNTGNVVAGEVGFAQRREFAVVGNPATVAARLQQAAEDVNAPIVAAASTFEPVREFFVGVPIDTLPLAGLKRLQRAYIVRGATKRVQEELLHLPAQISALQTVVAPEAPEPPAAAAKTAPSRTFSSFDDMLAAMPEPPALIGDYEEPQQSALAPLPPLPGYRATE
jgi:hypothetical protein